MARAPGLQDLQRNLRWEFTKLVTLLQAYALIAKGVRFHCSNQVNLLLVSVPHVTDAPRLIECA